MASRSMYEEALHADTARKKRKKSALTKPGWKPGALVRVKENVGWNNFTGIDATVLEHVPEEEQVLLEFDREFPQLHDGDGKGRPNCCLYVGDVQIYSVVRMPKPKAEFRPNVFTSNEVVMKLNEETTGEDEESQVVMSVDEISYDRLEAKVESMWPEGVGKAEIDQVKAEYFKKKNVAKYAHRVVMGEDVPDDSDEPRPSEPEEELFEKVRVTRDSPPQSVYAQFDPHAPIGGNVRTTSAGRTTPADGSVSGIEDNLRINIRRAGQLPLEVGDLCRIQNADGIRTPYDDISASILSKGKFGRFLLQFSRRIQGGHNGSGMGNDGRCKWFYAKDVVGISVNQAVMLDTASSKPKKSRRPKPSTVRLDAARSGDSWSPSRKMHPPDLAQNSDNMWDEEAIPPIKKSKKGGYLPPITTSGKILRGARVIVQAPPSDNKALKGQQGIVILSSPSNSNVTVQFDKTIMGCHDANGEGEKGRCWNLHKMFLKLLDTDIIFYIKEDYKRGNTNLKGKEVKILANIRHPSNESASVVEFEEEIPQGHSADGRGRKAHCLSVPASIIGKRKKEEPKRIKRPHEVKAKREAKKK